MPAGKQEVCIDCEQATQATHQCLDDATPLCDTHAAEHEDDGCEVVTMAEYEGLDEEDEDEDDDECEDEFEDDNDEELN